MRLLAVILAGGVLFSACGGSSSSPVTPTPTPPVGSLGLTGTWVGTASDTTGSETMNWTITQNGTTFTGRMSMSNSGRGMMGNGTMQGTVDGNAVTFHMGVPPGGFNGMMSGCSMTVDGHGTMSADGHTMTGTYSGMLSGMMGQTQTCGGTMSSGQFTLSR